MDVQAVAADPRLLDTRRAFDSVAADYDGPSGNNALIQRMRARTLRVALETFPRGGRILDAGCGTGMDAVTLARHGYRVVAADWSPEMVTRTRERVTSAGLEDQVEPRVVGLQELERLVGEPFDGIYSNLGPLNCVPDPDETASGCARILRPGGYMVASVIGRGCPWELAVYGLRGQFGRARLRFAREAVPVGLNGQTVWTRYYWPREFYAPFARDFALERYAALSLFLPPPYLVGAYQRLRPAFAPLGWLDDALGGLPALRNLGDHFLMVLRRRG